MDIQGLLRLLQWCDAVRAVGQKDASLAELLALECSSTMVHRCRSSANLHRKKEHIMEILTSISIFAIFLLCLHSSYFPSLFSLPVFLSYVASQFSSDVPPYAFLIVLILFPSVVSSICSFLFIPFPIIFSPTFFPILYLSDCLFSILFPMLLLVCFPMLLPYFLSHGLPYFLPRFFFPSSILDLCCSIW